MSCKTFLKRENKLCKQKSKILIACARQSEHTKLNRLKISFYLK